ncbi:hypothetical protein OSB04_025671 [Centaurea solstitialis]|uniref:Uncharacterized protein n=1 Tax=Centaurea solstitialis TaxID=347529 RepID=A0AA38SQ50_9ASTR|nr:hypothetical protein OSB04_025671 [Centaurea solstitialis]
MMIMYDGVLVGEDGEEKGGEEDGALVRKKVEKKMCNPTPIETNLELIETKARPIEKGRDPFIDLICSWKLECGVGDRENEIKWLSKIVVVSGSGQRWWWLLVVVLVVVVVRGGSRWQSEVGWLLVAMVADGGGGRWWWPMAGGGDGC